MEFGIVHSTTGRIRLRIPALKRSPAVADLLIHWLRREPGVCELRANPECASLVIRFSGDNQDWLAALGRVTIPQLHVERNGRSGMAPAVRGSKPATATSIAAGWRSYAALSMATAAAALSFMAVPFAGALAICLLITAAVPLWGRAAGVLVREKRLNVDFLDGLAILVCLLQADIFTAAFIQWLIALGDHIRDRTAAKSKRTIHELLNYQGRTAWVVRRRRVIQVAVGELAAGDAVMIYPGETIPVDGRVLEGCATVDQRTITGESMPVIMHPNSSVYAGTVVCDGKLKVRAMQVGSETAAAKIVQLIETAPVTETRVQNYAEKFADRLVAPWLGGATLLCLITGNVQRFLSMLIIDYGTGIRVAAPTSVLACMTAAARQGILIKSGGHMEKLARIDTVVFDKTGTLTWGKPEVAAVLSYDERRFPAAKILQVAGSAEARLRHPIAEAIVAKAKGAASRLPKRSNSRYMVGLGIEAQVNGYYVHVGSSRYFDQTGIDIGPSRRDLRRMEEQGCSTVLFAVDGELKGLIACRDEVREDSHAVVQALRTRGVREVVMLTGDNAKAARAVADRLGIDRCFAEMLPAAKAEAVAELQRQGRLVAMVGDGINDSPALAHADVGISMKHGADVAQETADVVLMEDNLQKLIGALDMSRYAIRLVRQNFGIIAGLNTLALGLSLPAGLVSPGVTAAISNGSAIVAGLNAVRPLVARRGG